MSESTIEEFCRIILNDGELKTVTLQTSKGSVQGYITAARVVDGRLFECNLTITGPHRPARMGLTLESPLEECTYERTEDAKQRCIFCGKVTPLHQRSYHRQSDRYKTPPPA